MTDNRLRYQRQIEAGAEDSLSKLAAMVPEGATVMDLGVGSGELGAWLTREKHCIVDGIEMSAEHISRAQPHYRRLVQADLEQADALADFDPGHYDCVVAADVLEHVRDREGVLRRAAELLKPGGELLLSVPNIGYAGVVLDLLEGRFDYRDEGILDDTHLRFYTRDSLCDFLGELDFRVVAIDTVTRPLHATEFSRFAPELLPASLVDALLAREDALAYQYLLRVRTDGGGNPVDYRPAKGVINCFEARLFWMSEGDLQHSEQKLQQRWAALNAQDNRLEFTLEDPAGIEVLRYFPADRAGVVELRHFEISIDSHSVDVCAADGLGSALSQNLLISRSESGYTLLCQASNAWFEVPLQPLLGATRPHRVQVSVVQSWPRSQDYSALLEAFADSNRQHAALADQVVEQRAHRRGLAGEIALLKATLEQREAEITRLKQPTERQGITAAAISLGRRVLRKLRRVLPPPTILSLDAVTNGERLEDGWLAMTGDSGHLYFPTPGQLAGKAVLFNIRFESHSRLWGPKLYEVINGELQEIKAPVHQDRGGRDIFGTLLIPPDLQGLVLAPSRLHSRLRIQQFSLRVLGPLANSLEDYWHWVWFYRSFGAAWVWRRMREDAAIFFENFPRLGKRREYADWWKKYGRTSGTELARQREESSAREDAPLISVVMPTYNTAPGLLELAVTSVLRQSYPHWELCIADDCSDRKDTRAMLKRVAAMDDRIKLTLRDSNGHIAAATNDAIALAGGRYVAFMDHDDELTPDALYHVAQALRQSRAPRLLYSDEDIVDVNGSPMRPHFKPDWNPDYLTSINYFCHLVVIERSLLEALGGLREGYEGAQDYDLVLRATAALDAADIHHIPRVLYHWRAVEGSTADSIDHKDYAVDAGRRALEDHAARSGLDAAAELSELGMAYRLRRRLPSTEPSVEILMPTRDSLDVLSHCVNSVLERTDYSNYRLSIIDNGSTDPDCLAFLRAIETDERVRVLPDHRDFNFSALVNSGAAQSDADVLVLLNNDIEVINPDWLIEMVSQAVREDVGAVGAKLFFASDYIQHAGVVLGVGPDAIAGHAFRGVHKHEIGHMGRLRLIQNYSAVTAACLAVRREIFLEVGGMDEVNLAVAFNDVDFCLKLVDAGYRNLWTPYAQLYHFESFSRGRETGERRARFERERDFMKQKWGQRLQEDPAYNPNLTLVYESFDLAWPPRA